MAHARALNPLRADKLLREMESRGSVKAHVYGEVLKAWCRAQGIDTILAIKKAKRMTQMILQAWTKESSDNSETEPLDTSCFFAFFELLEVTERRHGALNALRDLEQIFKHKPENLKGNLNFLVLATDMISQSGRSDAGSVVVSWLETARNLAARGLFEKLEIRALSSALKCLVQSCPYPLEAALQVYEEILERFNPNVKPVFTRPSILTSMLLYFVDIGREDRAMALLRRAISAGPNNPLGPNTTTFNALIRHLALAERPNTCFLFLQKMKELAKDGYPTFPNCISYSFTFGALAEVLCDTSAQRIRALAEEVLQMHQEGTLIPDIRLFNKMTRSLSMVSRIDKSAALDAYHIVHHLENVCEKDPSVTPDEASYRNVCQAFARSQSRDAPLMAEQVYLKAKALAAEGRIEPITRNLYFSAIMSYSKSYAEGAAMKAEETLIEMERLRDKGRSDLQPTTSMYNAVLAAYARSDLDNKESKALAVFRRMLSESEKQKSKCVPDGTTCDWVRH